ncbi:MAG TPA: response regulator [Candidatus Sericytochromatia bacterium]|jgi:chemotaxis family two-component system response regulator Rcp1
MSDKPLQVLLVEDDPGDVELTQEALKNSKLLIELNVVNDGEEAIAYLRQEGEYAEALRPSLILLDLNLPGMNGREVLQEIKNDDRLRLIPIVVLTTSDLQKDILNSYELGGNCYITKPVSLKDFMKIVQFIEAFWLTVVKLPTQEL